jgi:hypothetical protein
LNYQRSGKNIWDKYRSSEGSMGKMPSYERLEEGQQGLPVSKTETPSAVPALSCTVAGTREPRDARDLVASEPEVTAPLKEAPRAGDNEAVSDESLPPRAAAVSAAPEDTMQYQPSSTPVDASADGSLAVTSAPELPSAKATVISSPAKPSKARTPLSATKSESAAQTPPVAHCGPSAQSPVGSRGSTARTSPPASNGHGSSPARKDAGSATRTGSPPRTGGSVRPRATTDFAFDQPARSNESDTPGPGHYDLQSHDLTRRALVTANKTISQGKGTFMSSADADRSAPKLLFQHGVDPTAYSDYYLINASTGSQTSANKKVREGGIGFNSNVARCVDAAFEDRSGARGPGTYDYSHMYATSQNSGRARAGRGTTAFTSKVPLCGHVRKIDTPGAGEYSPELVKERGFSYSKAGSSAFAGNTARCASSIMPDGTAGPETYDLSGSSITAMASKKNPKSPPFGTSSRRL